MKFKIMENDKTWQPNSPDKEPKKGDSVSDIPNEEYSLIISDVNPPYFYYHSSRVWELMNVEQRKNISQLELIDNDGLHNNWKFHLEW